MTAKRIVTLDKVTLRLPHGADPQAVLREVSRAIAAGPVQSPTALRVTAAPALRGEGPQALAHRVGRATAARITSGDGS
jgi:hypothetical protein